jgi:hypothetical protein
VLFDGAQDCAQLFHLPLRVPNAMFDGLDDDVDDMPIDVGTPATAANPATAPVHNGNSMLKLGQYCTCR